MGGRWTLWAVGAGGSPKGLRHKEGKRRKEIRNQGWETAAGWENVHPLQSQPTSRPMQGQNLSSAEAV